MTLQELSQLTYLKKEIEIDQKQLEELEQAIGTKTVYLPNVPCFTIQNIKDELIQGITDCKLLLEKRMKQSIQEYKKLNEFVSNIDDSMMRQIIMLRFIQGLSWVQIALHLGGGNSADGVRMMVKRYLNKYNTRAQIDKR